MTVAEAIEKLQKLPQDLDLEIDGDTGPYKVLDCRIARHERGQITYRTGARGKKVVVVW